MKQDFATVIVAAMRDSRRRIGLEFGKTPSEPFGVREDELNALQADPYLLVIMAAAEDKDKKPKA